ncbi:MAG: hypothetical protein IPL22_21435 [Bacteroidetes bacterium]|nr:hypothetical protein [Bacteroidota bacterium]
MPFLWILLLKTIDRPIGRNSFIHGSGRHQMEVTLAPIQTATIAMATTPVEARILVVVEMVGIRGS